MRTQFTFLMLISLAAFVQAEDRIQLQRDSVIGNEESPKALYVVPWRPLNPVGIEGLQIETLLDEQLELIDPETFRRQVELHQVSVEEKNNKTR